MNNLSFSSKFSPQHDNGERTLYWRAGATPEADGNYLITTIHGDVRPFEYRGLWYDSIHPHYPKENVVAYMKLPTPYKPN